MPDRTKIFGTAAGIAVTAALSACSASAGTPPSQPAPVSVTGNDHSSSAPESKSDYADGQYSAEGRYGSLPSSIGVTITLTEDIVTAVSVTPRATDPTSLDLQRRFAAAVPTVVVGRNIDEIEVDKLAGSSGTSQGFNAALEEIKAQAT
jgi:uncharacterized protein with FMN-binding domain